MFRAQGTIEYLLIIAIVVVIALVVVGLLIGFLNQGSQVDQTANQTYWQTQPLAILESQKNDNGELLIVLKNNTGNNITLTQITINESIYDIEDTFLAQNDKKTILLNGQTITATNTPYIKLSYTTPQGLNKTQTSSQTLNPQNTTNDLVASTQYINLIEENCFDWDDTTPHTICTCDDLNTIDYNSTTLGWTYILQNNLNFSNCDSTYNTDDGWRPIGTEAAKFSGNFLGNNKTITNVYVNKPDTDYVGLFGYINSNSSDINNLGMIDSNITGQNYVGGINGRNGTVNNSYNTGTTNGTGSRTGGINGSSGTINNSYNTGIVNGTNYTGGINGNGGTINNSYNTGTTNGTQYVGGINGASGTINNSYNTGTTNGTTYIAGINGIQGTTNNSYNTGTITGTGNNIGGINGGYGTVNNSYNLGNIKGASNVGGIIGYFAAEKSVINSFSTGSLKGTSSSTNFGTIGYDGGGTITNIYWYDSNSIDSASPSECIQGGSTNCTYLDDTNYTQLFTSTTDIYDTAPAWDGNWVWSGSAYPTLSWE